jgi:hypothetical protein
MSVTPAQAGVHFCLEIKMDARIRGHDAEKKIQTETLQIYPLIG